MRPEIFLARKGFRTMTMKKTFRKVCDRLALQMQLGKRMSYPERLLNIAWEKMMGRI
ncbi:MAG: hypothetical protein ACO20H_06170 [Bacteriovoracaceae bacterium]